MPYRRIIRLQTDAASWQQVELLAPHEDWSPTYRVESPRLLIPEQARVELELDGRRIAADALQGMWLLPDQPYRLRHTLHSQRSSVLVVREGAVSWRRSGPVPLDADWRLRLRAVADPARHARSGDLNGLLNEALSRPCLPAPHAAVERAREFLAARFAENDSLAAIGRAAACSPYQLARLFRRHTGRTLHGYRTALRLAEALRRLEQGEHQLAGLAAELGFSHHSHFSAVFRQAFGRPPAAMRTILTAPALH